PSSHQKALPKVLRIIFISAYIYIKVPLNLPWIFRSFIYYYHSHYHRVSSPSKSHHSTSVTPRQLTNSRPPIMAQTLPPGVRIHNDPSSPKRRSLRATRAFSPGSAIATFANPLLALPDGATMRTACNYCLRTTAPS